MGSVAMNLRRPIRSFLIITTPSEIFWENPSEIFWEKIDFLHLRWTGDNKNFAAGLVIISDGLKNFANNPVPVRGNSGVNKAGPYGFRFRESYSENIRKFSHEKQPKNRLKSDRK